MGHSRLWCICSAAHAWASKKSKLSSPLPSCAADEETEVEILSEDFPEIIDLTGIPSEAEKTQWTGGVAFHQRISERVAASFDWSRLDCGCVFPIWVYIMSSCQISGGQKNNSTSFDPDENLFDHFVRLSKRSVFTKRIRNQATFGHIILVAQKWRWLGVRHHRSQRQIPSTDWDLLD